MLPAGKPPHLATPSPGGRADSGGGGGGVKAPFSTKDQARYDKLRGQAISDLMNPDCLQFLCSHGIDPTMLQITLGMQQAYNGSQSTITKAAADVGIPGAGTTVAEAFNDNPGVHAAASLNGTDAYFRSGGFWFFPNTNISESTIEHEALHNLTRLGDPSLQTQLGVPVNTTDTTNINEQLKEHHCTH